MAQQFQKGDKVLNKITNKSGIVRLVRVRSNGVEECKVEFSEQQTEFVKAIDLEKVSEDPIELYENRVFMGIDTLKRVLTYARIKGDVTNIFYSMNNKATSFFAHQFIPVMKFIESTSGRLLIADEVGLGKTIEAMYIWEELVARENCRRLLIVCPSVLRDKWAHDIYKYFSIHAEIVDASQLLTHLKNAKEKPQVERFVLIVSLEGIRYKEKVNTVKEQKTSKSSRALLDEMLDDASVDSLNSLLDMVVVDEAHYLRNSETASNKTVAKLRDNTENLVLLSATPIQTSEANLYNLLNILDPEVFYDLHTFCSLLDKSKNYVSLANSLQNNCSEAKIQEQLTLIKSSKAFVSDDLIERFSNELPNIVGNPEKRLEYYNQLMKKVFYSSYFTRTRRKQAFEKNARRHANTWTYSMSEYERSVYDRVTKVLREEASRADEFCQFKIMARQRQMTSCMPAAFLDWENKEFGKDLQELLLEDFDYSNEDFESSDDFDISRIYSRFGASIDSAYLRQNDSKFFKLKDEIKKSLREDPNRKMIIFSFYRGTVKYLVERFSEEGIKCISLVGGLGINKQEVIDIFREDPSIRLLISTEVGSEGIDLQFCDTEVNYDLPWNPMRLEQRIGRIDRIGQKSTDLNIINMSCDGSIEDRVLQKLYSRINIFKTSIGEIDDILGKEIQDLALSLMSNLSEEELEREADAKIDYLVGKKQMMDELEEKAPTSVAFKDLILDVKEANKVQRFIHSADLIFYVRDFLEMQWPGSCVEDHPTYSGAKYITLSKFASQDFLEYSRNQGLDSVICRGNGKILCLFDPSLKEKIRVKTFDVITPTHPLIKWINQYNANHAIMDSGCCSISVRLDDDEIPKGMYAFYLMEISAQGYVNKKEIHYYMCRVDDLEMLPAKKAEFVFMNIFAHGKENISTDNYSWKSDSADEDALDDACYKAIDIAQDEFDAFYANYSTENAEVCKNQLDYLSITTARKISSLEETIENMKKAGGREQGLKLFASKLSKAKKNFEFQRKQIEKKNNPYVSYNDVALGLIEIL